MRMFFVIAGAIAAIAAILNFYKIFAEERNDKEKTDASID